MPNPALLAYRDPAGAWAAAVAVSGYRVSRPIEATPSCIQVAQTFVQDAASWLPSAPGNAGPVIAGQATYLISESQTEDIGDNILQWDRIWCAIPPSRIEPAGAIVHNYVIPHTVTYQAFDGYTEGTNPVAKYKTVTYTTYENLVKTVAAKRSYNYSRNASMSPPGPSGGLIVHEPGGVTLWRGDIYEGVTILVPS